MKRFSKIKCIPTEVTSGRTSSSSHHILGFDNDNNIVSENKTRKCHGLKL